MSLFSGLGNFVGAFAEGLVEAQKQSYERREEERQAIEEIKTHLGTLDPSLLAQALRDLGLTGEGAPLPPARECTVWTPEELCEDRDCFRHSHSKKRDLTKLR